MSTLNRQLAAILFTDIEGYSAIMQQDEQKAIFLKDRHREILQKEHDRFNGRIIQYYGDGALSIFQSAVQAVICARAMQQVFCLDPVVPVRMGIHMGDVVIDEQQVFGDGVNLASRIESLGVAGSVLLSDRVNDEIKNHPELKTVSMGRYHLKNIRRETEVFAVDHPGLVVPEPHTLEGKTEKEKKPPKKSNGKPAVLEGHAVSSVPEKSIAVLPFVNMSNDPEQEYFGEGIAEEILNSLAGLEDLKVAGRTSAFKFDRRNLDLKELGGRLGVSKVLDGSVRKQGNHLRVTVQLVNVEDGFHLWSEKYEGNMDDIFTIQDKVAQAITRKLKVTLLQKDRSPVSKGSTQNTEAYQLYLKGRFYVNKRGAAILTGIHCFQLAIDLDPDFALAHTGYADANLMAAFYGLLPPKQVLERARKSAETALRIDPTMCEPYCSLGCYHCFEWNWKEGEKNFLKSIELNPRYTQAHYWYGSSFLAWGKGDFVEAEKHGRIAIELEPFSSICYGLYASILHTAGKFQLALSASKTGVELDPDSFICRLFEGWSHLSLHDYEKAIPVFESLYESYKGYHFAQNALIIAYCIVWRFNKARELMNELTKRAEKEFIGTAITGLTAAYLEDLDLSLAYLEKACREHDPLLLSFRYENWVPDNLKADIRFWDILSRMGFPSR